MLTQPVLRGQASSGCDTTRNDENNLMALGLAAALSCPATAARCDDENEQSMKP
jgi:hypothetical protein